MPDLRKRRLRLVVATGVVFVAISVAGALAGKALGWPPLAATAVTAIVAVAFAVTMTERIKRLK